MPSCAAVGCKTGLKAHPEEKHQLMALPKDQFWRNKWLKSLNRDFTPSDQTRICAKHFEADYFVPEDENKTKKGKPKAFLTLKEFAVPTLHLKEPKSESVSLRRYGSTEQKMMLHQYSTFLSQKSDKRSFQMYLSQ